MGSISVNTIALLVAGGTTVAEAYQQHEQGVAVSNQNKAKARVEALNATQRQIEMRQNMLRALASQNAGTLGGIGTGGASSFGANTRRQLTEGQNDLLVNSANASGQISLLDQAGRNAIRQGNTNAVIDLAKGASAAMGGG